MKNLEFDGLEFIDDKEDGGFQVRSNGSFCFRIYRSGQAALYKWLKEKIIEDMGQLPPDNPPRAGEKETK